MTIETVCPECGKSYRVRDEMAGKRFRCKACQAAVSIPVPASSEAADDDTGNDDWDDDFLGGLDTAVKSERRAPTGGPPPIAGRSGHRSSASSRKKPRSKSDEAGGSTLKLIVGLVSGAVGLVVGYLVVATLMSSGSGAPDWTGFTSPDGTYQVEFPAAPQLKPFPTAAADAERYVGETPQLGAAVTEAPFPPEAANGFSLQALAKVAEQNAQQRPGATMGDKRPLTFGKHPALEFTLTAHAGEKQLAETTRIVLTDKAVYTLEFVADGPDHAAERDRFFNSFGLLGDVTADWNDKGSSP